MRSFYKVAHDRVAPEVVKACDANQRGFSSWTNFGGAVLGVGCLLAVADVVASGYFSSALKKLAYQGSVHIRDPMMLFARVVEEGVDLCIDPAGVMLNYASLASDELAHFQYHVRRGPLGGFLREDNDIERAL